MNHNTSQLKTTPHPTVVCRGVRGAITAQANTIEAILDATKNLLQQLITQNQIEEVEVASIYFTMTPDLNAAYPALAARQLGWCQVALLCSQEIDVPGGLARCIRVLIHWNTHRQPSELAHIYLEEAVVLRPDWAAQGDKP